MKESPEERAARWIIYFYKKKLGLQAALSRESYYYTLMRLINKLGILSASGFSSYNRIAVPIPLPARVDGGAA